MMHHTPLLTIIVGGIVLAFVFGTLAQRLRMPPLVGYLLAGVAVGPFTPGFVADQGLANELSEIGIILLMFGVGLHFSVKDLLSVRAIAVPGALVQIVVATLMGMGLAHALGWSLMAGLVFGLSLSVASTVVLLRALQERRLLETERGKIAISWLIVEDLAMVLALVLLPAIAKSGGGTGMDKSLLLALLITLSKVGAFIAIMLVVGRRVIPWILHYTAHSGSRELFRLAVLAIALGVAYGAAALFGVSFALGAFFAGMVLSESELSQRATEETLPLRDAFAVLFFVSVGMLFDPGIIWRNPGPVLAVCLIITVGKSLAAYAIVRAFGHPSGTALTIAASLGQIGEFSFILAGLGVSLALLPEAGRDLILAGAILSILLNPGFFYVLEKLHPYLEKAPQPSHPTRSRIEEPLETTTLEGHVIVVGCGRVGTAIVEEMRQRGHPVLIVEENPDILARAATANWPAIPGNAARADVLAAANLQGATCLFVAIPNGFEAGRVVQLAKATHPDLPIIVRAHSDPEAHHLQQLGANSVIMGEREIAYGMIGQMA